MLQWMIVMPLIALLVERLLEVFDALVTLNLFPWWRSAPSAPPKMFLQRPSRTAWRKELPANTDAEPKMAKVVHNVGTDTLEFPVHAVAEAVLYYEKERALYGNRLKHYVSRNGYFFPRQADATGELWVQSSSWRLALESRLARREQIPDVGKEAQFARLVRDMTVDGRINERQRIQTLEKLADYCYLRNRSTYRAFSFLIRDWPRVDMFMNLDGIERFRPGFAILARYKGAPAPGPEYFEVPAELAPRVFPAWSDAGGRPQLELLLYPLDEQAVSSLSAASRPYTQQQPSMIANGMMNTRNIGNSRNSISTSSAAVTPYLRNG